MKTLTHKERTNRHPGEIDLEIKRLNTLLKQQRRVVKEIETRLDNADGDDFNNVLIEFNDAHNRLFQLIELRNEERKMLKAATKHMRTR